MRWFGVAVCAVLLAGSINALQELTRNAGEEYTFNVLAFPQTVVSCHLKTPNGDILDFNPEEPSKHGSKYELLPISTTMPSCSVTLKNLDVSDTGVWEVSFRNASGKGSSQDFDLSVIGGGISEISRGAKEHDGILWLNPIEFPTGPGQNIDISLSKTAYPEDCYVRKPEGSDVLITNLNIEGVTVHSSSDFVSCRITIGPMEATMLGDWTLCGKRTDNNEEQDRCQLVRITWNNNDHPEREWDTFNQTKFNHVVHVGGTLTPVVIGSGNRITCHVITPNDEDLVIDADSDYPNLKLVATDTSKCSIAIGPIAASMLGNWALYGKFRDFTGLHEVHLPMNLFLYDENNPYAQAYNLTVRAATRHVINLGSTINVEVTSTGQLDSCQFIPPFGETFDLNSDSYEGVSFVKVEDRISCRIAIGPLTEQLLGNWTVIGKFSYNGRFTELQQPFQIIKEDPENPIIDEDRTVVNLNKQNVITEIGSLHRIIIHSNDFISGESCHIRTPRGLQYTLMEGFSVPGVEVIEENGVECGVFVHVLSKDTNGTWTLIARATRYSQPIERRLPFTINIEVNSALETEITTTTIELVRDRSVNKTVGPDSAVYCHLIDPQGVTVFDGFGRCNLALDKVTPNHHGTWKMLVGIANKVIAVEHVLSVIVKESEGKPVVTTHVAQQKPSITVSCSVATEATVRACKFRDPQGRILLAANGISEDRFVFHGAETTYQSEVRTHECGLEIRDPLVSELGLWRCAIETDEDTYYGFMAVLCPWALQDPNVAATVQQVPILRTQTALIEAIEAEPVIMSCSVESAIRYCYFRAANGSTFSVSPGMSSPDMEYVGTGFEAGECGVRFHGMKTGDSGRWNCHVGLVNEHEEQRDQFQLNVQEAMSVDHYYSHGSNMIVEGVVHGNRALEYCRYVRIDGVGFTTENIPAEYTNSGIIANGVCQLSIRNPTILDMHPWTVVAKILGHDSEISKDTMEAILIGESTTPAPEADVIQIWVSGRRGGLGVFLYVFLSVLFVSIILGAWLGPKKNREWTHSRACAFRQSMRNSFRKQPLPDTDRV